jgi:membrane protease YdiL (CAAX protease family)
MMADRDEAAGRVFRFFGWVFALTIPFYVWGVVWPVGGLPFGLPATAVMVVIPAAVATLRVKRETGTAAAWALWRRVGDVRRIGGPLWAALAVLSMPAVALAAYGMMRVLGRPLPETISPPLAETPLIFAAFFLGAILEEIGWTLYATETLQRRYGVVGAGLMIGAVWALWHVPPWWLGQGHAPSWVAGQCLATVAMRVVMGWIYAKGGRSLFLAILFHAMINTSYSLFPNQGSHYDPLTSAAILAIMAIAVTVSARKAKPEEAGTGRRLP